MVSTRIGPIISRRGQGRRLPFARPAAQRDHRKLSNGLEQCTQGTKDLSLDLGVQTSPDTAEQEESVRTAALGGAPADSSSAMGPRLAGKDSRAVVKSPKITQNVNVKPMGWYGHIVSLERAIRERYAEAFKEAKEEVQKLVKSETRADVCVNAFIGALAANGVPEHRESADSSTPRHEGAQILQYILQADPEELERARDALKKHLEDKRRKAEEKMEGLKNERRVALTEVDQLRKNLEGLPAMGRNPRTAIKRVRAGGSGVMNASRMKRSRGVVGEHEEVLDGSGPMDDCDDDDAKEGR